MESTKVNITIETIMKHYVCKTKTNSESKTFIQLDYERLYKCGFQIIYDLDVQRYRCISSAIPIPSNYCPCITKYLSVKILHNMLKNIKIKDEFNYTHKSQPWKINLTNNLEPII